MRALVLFVLLTGCVSAQFNSTTGKSYAPLTSRAIILSPDEAAQIQGKAEVIGTVSAQSRGAQSDLNNTSNEDLAAKAAQLAAEHGGTHIVATSFDPVTSTWVNPATVTRQCSHDEGTRTCEKTYTPETTGSATFAAGEFTVYRVASELWSSLPPELRPR